MKKTGTARGGAGLRRAGVPRVVVTERDTAVLEAVFCHTALTRPAVQELLGFGSVARVNARLLHLLRLGLLHRHYYHLPDGLCGAAAPGGPAIYTASKQAACLIAPRIGWDEDAVRALCRADVTHGLLAHTLRCADFILAVRRDPAVRAADEGQAGWHLGRWLPERLARDTFEVRVPDAPAAGWRRVEFKPDAALELCRRDAGTGEVTARRWFLLEVDSGSQSLRVIRAKLELHDLYARTMFPRRYGPGASFLTLFVTTGEARAASLRAVAAETGCARVRCTTWRRIAEGGACSGAIWSAPEGVATPHRIALLPGETRTSGAL